MGKVRFFDYVRANLKWLLALAFCGLGMAVILILNHVPNGEILYGLLLCAVLCICVVAGLLCLPQKMPETCGVPGGGGGFAGRAYRVQSPGGAAVSGAAADTV